MGKSVKGPHNSIHGNPAMGLKGTHTGANPGGKKGGMAGPTKATLKGNAWGGKGVGKVP